MANTASQLITLIMLLQRRPNQSGAQLAQELNVSVRPDHARCRDNPGRLESV